MTNLTTKQKLLVTVERIADLLALLVKSSSTEISVPVQKEEHVTVEWIVDFLEIHKSNFYRNVNNKMLRPVVYVGRRPYYLKRDVQKLLQPHEPGAHTFSKLLRKTFYGKRKVK